MSKSQKLDLIYLHTHSDFKGCYDGVRKMSVWRDGAGTCSIRLEDLSDAEIEDRLASALRKRESRSV